MVKIFSNLFFLVLALGGVRGASIKCEKTVTTATLSGFKKSPTEKKVCSGELIFEETFENFDLDVWQHDSTLNGDRVSFAMAFKKCRKKCLWHFHRNGNFNGTQTTEAIPLWKMET